MPIKQGARLGTTRLRKNRKLRGLEDSPDDLEIYRIKRLSAERRPTITRKRGMPLPKSLAYSIFKLGTRLNYHGMRTYKYGMSDLERVMLVDRNSIKRMVRNGIFDPPMIQIQGERGSPKKIWLYHQVHPVALWYHSMRARTHDNVIRRYTPEDMKALARDKERAKRKFHERSGIPRTDTYESQAGKFGVIWENTVVDPPF